jgi:hypothetical protein
MWTESGFSLPNIQNTSLGLVKAKPPQFPEGVLLLELELLVDLGNGTGTYGAATLTDRETLSLFKRNRLN